jgi:hypothetical protein
MISAPAATEAMSDWMTILPVPGSRYACAGEEHNKAIEKNRAVFIEG